MSKSGTGLLRSHPLKDRVAVISGATGATGRAAALGLARQGARLALVSSSLEKLETLQNELMLPEERTLLCAADLREAGAPRYLAEAVLARFGRLDILLHLVGGWTGGESATRVSPETVAQMIDQHLWTTFHMQQACVPPMLTNNWGRVIVVSSPAAIRPGAGTPAFSVGKAAMEALLLSLAAEIKGSGVTANIIQVRTINIGTEAKTGQTTPDEISAAVLYLCSEEANLVNGVRLPLTGESL